MKDQYRVVIIVPAGYKHSLCFTEVAFLLRNTLMANGIGCDLTVNELAQDRINIILGFHLLNFGDYLSPYRYIPYQLEQLSASEGVFSDNVKSILSRGIAVWDYSQENIGFLKSQGISAQHLPVGFHESLEQIPQDKEKDIDVLFFGSLGDRRQAILSKLEKSGRASVKTLFGVYGKERDEYIARAKILLNIHYYSTKIFEAVRVSYLLNNRCCVISEESSVYPYPGVNIPLVPYDSLVDACLDVLDKKDEGAGMDAYKTFGDVSYQEFKTRYEMKKLITKVLPAAS
jgi:hypothetical protein